MFDAGNPPIPWPYRVTPIYHGWEVQAAWNEYMHSGYATSRGWAIARAMWAVFWYRIHENAHPRVYFIDYMHECWMTRLGNI